MENIGLVIRLEPSIFCQIRPDNDRIRAMRIHPLQGRVIISLTCFRDPNATDDSRFECLSGVWSLRSICETGLLDIL